MGLKERRKKIMALMLAACVAGTSVVPVAASDVSVFSDGTDASPEAFDSADVDSANGAATKTVKINYYSEEEKKQIAEVDYTVDKDATSVNTSKLTAPKGYELVLSGDLFKIGPWAEYFPAVFGSSVECMHSYCPASFLYILKCSCYCTFFEVQDLVIAIVVWTSLSVFFLVILMALQVMTT